MKLNIPFFGADKKIVLYRNIGIVETSEYKYIFRLVNTSQKSEVPVKPVVVLYEQVKKALQIIPGYPNAKETDKNIILTDISNKTAVRVRKMDVYYSQDKAEKNYREFHEFMSSNYLHVLSKKDVEFLKKFSNNANNTEDHTCGFGFDSNKLFLTNGNTRITIKYLDVSNLANRTVNVLTSGSIVYKEGEYYQITDEPHGVIKLPEFSKTFKSKTINNFDNIINKTKKNKMHPLTAEIVECVGKLKEYAFVVITKKQGSVIIHDENQEILFKAEDPGFPDDTIHARTEDILNLKDIATHTKFSIYQDEKVRQLNWETDHPNFGRLSGMISLARD